jgi:uncharacterized protein YebE (UPF0316 family)
MDFSSSLSIDAEFYWSFVFPVVIACSRVVDVILGTFRIVLVIQGRKFLATVFGFFEVLIWVMVAGQVMGQLDNFSYYIAWALGFAIGTFVGMSIEEKISLGSCIIRIIVKDNPSGLLDLLDSNKIYSTVVDARSRDDKDTIIIFSIIPRKRLKLVESLIESVSPNSMYTIENLRSVHQTSSFIQDDRQINFFRRFFPRGKSK